MSLHQYWPRGVGVKAILDNVTKYEGFFKASLIKVIGKGQGKVR